VNWTEASIKAFKSTYSAAECAARPINVPAPVVEQPEPTTNSPYDAVGKSITEELAAMEQRGRLRAGVERLRSVEVLDRLERRLRRRGRD
jgi:hypothetical protein